MDDLVATSSPAAEAAASPSRPSLLINALSNWGALGIDICVAFALTPYIIHHLGIFNYGIYALIISVIGYYGLLDLGISSAIMRYVARYAGQDDTLALNQTVNTAFFGFSALGLAVMACTFFLAKPLGHFFHVSGGDLQSFQVVIRLFGVSAGIMFPTSVLTVVLLAHERFVWANAVRISNGLLKLILSVLCLYMGGGMIALGEVNVFLSFFQLSMNLLLIVLFLKSLKFSPGFFSRATLGTLCSFGFFTFIVQVGDLLRFRLGTVIVGRFLTLELVGLYAIGASLFSYVMNLTLACSGVTQPRLAALAGREDPTEFRQSFLRYATMVSVFTAAVGAVILSMVSDFIHLWLHRTPYETHVAAISFSILLAGLLPDLMTNVSNNALLALRKHYWLSWQTIAEGFLSFALALWLVRSMGFYGVALATALPALVTKVLIQPVYTARIVGIGWPEYFLKVLARPLALVIVVLSLTEFLGSHWNLAAHSLVLLMCKSALLFLVTSIAAFLFCLDGELRQLIIQELLHVQGAVRIKLGYHTELG